MIDLYDSLIHNLMMLKKFILQKDIDAMMENWTEGHLIGKIIVDNVRTVI